MATSAPSAAAVAPHAIADGDQVREEEDELAMLDALAPVPAATRPRAPVFAQRSSALLQHARHCKRTRELLTKLNNAQEQAAQQERKLAMVAVEVPALRRALGRGALACLSPEELVVAHVRVAASSKARGSHGRNQDKLQARITHSVASTLLDIQQGHVCEVALGPKDYAADSSAISAGTFVMSLQFDEAQQHLKPLQRALGQGATEGICSPSTGHERQRKLCSSDAGAHERWLYSS